MVNQVNWNELFISQFSNKCLEHIRDSENMLGKQNDTKYRVAMGKDPELVTEVGTYSVVHEKI